MKQGGRIFPCIFVLVHNKIEAAYRWFMAGFSNVAKGRTNTSITNITNILVNLKRSAINAF